MDKNKAETIVKIFSIIGIIFSVLSILLGLVLVFGGQLLSGLLTVTFGNIGSMISGAILIIAIIIILFSALLIWGYVNLMKFKDIARILLLIYSFIVFITSILSFPFSIVPLAYHGAFIYFFLINKDVKELFVKAQ